MMAEKARTFGDEAALASVLATPSPAEAKQAGRSVRNFDAQRWAILSTDVVLRSNLAKFGQNLALRDFLLATGDKILVEASPYDCIWGIGLDEMHPDAVWPDRWLGRNLLGVVLMRVREMLG